MRRLFRSITEFDPDHDVSIWHNVCGFGRSVFANKKADLGNTNSIPKTRSDSQKCEHILAILRRALWFTGSDLNLKEISSKNE